MSSLFLLPYITGCAPGWYYKTEPRPQGVYHIVKPGQTLWRIARTYGVPIDEVVKANNIEDAARIKVLSRIFIPGATKVLEVDIYKPKEEEIDFIRPLDGKIISHFGRRKDTFHTGIDIKAEEGRGFVAASDGIVGYSGNLKGYGNLIIVKHNKAFSTVYAHNQVNLVKEGDKVKQNDVIGKVGNSGRASCFHLHFEIRKEGKAQDPLLYLPN